MKIRNKPPSDFSGATQTVEWIGQFVWDYVKNADIQINPTDWTTTVTCVDTSIVMTLTDAVTARTPEKEFEKKIRWTPKSGEFTSSKCTLTVSGHSLTDTYDFTVYPIIIKDTPGKWLDTSTSVTASVLSPYSKQLR